MQLLCATAFDSFSRLELERTYNEFTTELERTYRTYSLIHCIESASLTNSYICICFHKLVSIKRHFCVVQIATMGFKRNDLR
jgi:hypothetical protein